MKQADKDAFKAMTVPERIRQSVKQVAANWPKPEPTTSIFDQLANIRASLTLQNPVVKVRLNLFPPGVVVWPKSRAQFSWLPDVTINDSDSVLQATADYLEGSAK
jgi:hypothetical protein